MQIIQFNSNAFLSIQSYFQFIHFFIPALQTEIFIITCCRRYFLFYYVNKLWGMGMFVLVYALGDNRNKRQRHKKCFKSCLLSTCKMNFLFYLFSEELLKKWFICESPIKKILKIIMENIPITITESTVLTSFKIK